MRIDEGKEAFFTIFSGRSAPWLFVSLELVQRERDVHLSSSNRACSAVVWSVSAARIIFVKHDEPREGTEDIGTGGVLGKVLGPSTVRHFRPWLGYHSFFPRLLVQLQKIELNV